MLNQLVAAATSVGWWGGVGIVIGFIAIVLYSLYLLALPTPLKGIPYNKDASKRLMGDVTEILSYEEAGITPRLFWTDLAKKHKSPIVQYFLGPFSSPGVIVADYREAVDLMVKRGNNFGRGKVVRGAWAGIMPEHFIGMDNDDPRYQETKGLKKDLMTPKFLHEVNGPACYEKASEFIEYWRLKAKLADGHPFDAYDDLASFTYDIILAAAVGVNNVKSEATQNLQQLKTEDLRGLAPNSKDELFPFPDIETSELRFAVQTISKAAGKAFMQPFQRAWHFFNNRTAPMRRAHKAKWDILQSYVKQSSQRLREEGEKFRPRSALDFMVQREITLAERAGRPPNLDSLRINDIIFGYLLAGEDSTLCTLSFLIKRLGDHQDVQERLRRDLHQACPGALAQREQPSLQEILKTPVPYLDAVIEEVLRLHDPAMGITKVTLSDMNILGHFVPKDTIVFFATTGPTFKERGLPTTESSRSETSQKNRQVKLGDWAESELPTEQFHPQRWLRQSDEKEGEVVYDPQAGPILGFSAGKRGCWGKRLAYLDLKLAVALLVWNFSFEQLPEGMSDWEIDEDLFIKPRHCRVKLRIAAPMYGSS